MMSMTNTKTKNTMSKFNFAKIYALNPMFKFVFIKIYVLNLVFMFVFIKIYNPEQFSSCLHYGIVCHRNII